MHSHRGVLEVLHCIADNTQGNPICSQTGLQIEFVCQQVGVGHLTRDFLSFSSHLQFL